MRIIIEELFCFIGSAMIVFFGMELLWPRIVLAYFNYTWLILVWLLAGIILLFLPREE